MTRSVPRDGKKYYPTGRLVADYLVKNSGILTHYTDIARDLNIPENRVNAAANRIARLAPEFGITKEGPAGYYIHRTSNGQVTQIPTASPTAVGELWEVIGNLNGRTLVRHTNGETLKFLQDE